MLLRSAYARRTAIAIGAALVALAAALWWMDYAWESALTDGLGLVAGATGVAFIVAGLQGRRADWIDENSESRIQNSEEGRQQGGSTRLE